MSKPESGIGQKCERKYGDSMCPFHPENKVVSLCQECSSLVCLDCITSSEHRSHSFHKLNDIVKKKSNDTYRFMENIKRSIKPKIKQNLELIEQKENHARKKESSLLNELSTHKKKCIQLLDEKEDAISFEIQEFYRKQYKKFEAVKSSLNEMDKDFECFLMEFQKKIENGTIVEKYDLTQSVSKKEKEANLMPVIPDFDTLGLVYIEGDTKDLVKSALGKVTRYSAKKEQSICTSSSFCNVSQIYFSVTPIKEDKAWCGIQKYDKDTKQNVPTNQFCLIKKQGDIERKLQTKAAILYLCLHPITGVLYGTFDDKTICTIDQNTGDATTILKCSYQPLCLAVTSNGDIIVGEFLTYPGYLYRISPCGKLLYQSKKKYKVYDISYSTVDEHIAIACGPLGVTILDDKLSTEIHYHKMWCKTAVFDKDGTLMIGDFDMKAIHVLDGQTFSTIRTFKPPKMSNPAKIRLFDNSMWLDCLDEIKHFTFKETMSAFKL